MNVKIKFSCAGLVAVAAVLLAGDLPAFAGPEPTAFQLVKDGNRYVGEPSRNQVLGIGSKKSIAGLTPSLWTVSYFDPDAKSKIVEVEFGSGLKLDVERPWRPFGVGAAAHVMPLDKFKVDSDQAIRIATGLQMLSPFTLKNTQLLLQPSDDGPVWRVRLWAAKLGKPEVVLEIGEVSISPVTGEVVRAKLHIKRLN